MVLADRRTPPDKPKAAQKLRYLKPQLVFLGKVSELTAGVKGSGGDFARRKT